MELNDPYLVAYVLYCGAQCHGVYLNEHRRVTFIFNPDHVQPAMASWATKNAPVEMSAYTDILKWVRETIEQRKRG